MVLPTELMKQYKKEGSFLSSTVPRMDQRILFSFLKEGCFERYLNRMRKVYRMKHDILLNALKPFEKLFTISGEDAGLHILLQSKSDISEEELVKKAKEKGVKVYGLSEYEILQKGEKGKATIILGYAGLKEREIVNGMERLQEAWLKENSLFS